MKTLVIIALMTMACAIALPTYADSLLKGAAKVKVLKEVTKDTTSEDANKAEDTAETIKDEDDSPLKKAVKIKAIRKIGN